MKNHQSANPFKTKGIKMKDVRKTYYFLMIFLLFWFVVPAHTLIAQPKITEQQVIEQQILDDLRAGNAFGQNGNNIELPAYLNETDDLENRRKNLLNGTDGNYVNLYMKGNENQVTANQVGKGNAMEILVNGNENKLNYQQTGDNNYLLDAVLGNNRHHKITQEGSERGLYLQGQQTIPMIINQRGYGAKFRITGSPPIKK